METIGINPDDDFEINSAKKSIKQTLQAPIDSSEIFEITLVDSLGGSKTVWDKPTITKEELQLYFPDTLGGVVDNETRRPVREDTKLQAFVLKNNHSYEIRIFSSATKATKSVVSAQTKQTTTTVRENSAHNIYQEDKENFLNGTISDAGSEDESEDSYDREDYGKKMNTRKRKSRPLEAISLNRSTPKDRDVPSFSSETSYTWSELIEEALRTLGGKRTGQEITSYIEENYSDMLSNKTKTWKNSVMGCLSSNARKLWIKEATVVDGKKRFVWCLKNDSNVVQKHNNTQEKDTPSTSTTLAVPQQTSKQMEIGSPFAAKALSRLQRGHSVETSNSPAKSAQSKVKSKLFKENGQISSPTKASLFLLSSLASSDSESNSASQKNEDPSAKRRKLPVECASSTSHPDDEEDVLPEVESDEEQLSTALPDHPQDIVLPVH